jgi:hypothetical protein
MTVEASGVRAPAPRTLPGRGNWWVYPATVFIGLGGFAIYSFWSIALASGGNHWHVGPYLSPFYSPLFRPSWWPLSPALLVFWAPLAFRATCYYYRKAYYRGFFWDPPTCAIREPRHGGYSGETRFPFVLNNFHRFFLYLALVVLAVLWFDAINAFRYHGSFYVGFGSILMLVNVILLTGYTFSCHALRHLVGGNVDCFSCVRFGRARHGMWQAVSAINPFHGNWAWASLISVVAVDVYIRLVSAGVFGSGCFGSHTGC